ncbi:zinc ribbon domain-containing protein [bacterium]|nr:zinc ribbon domain-containing protein [bacterium]
MPHYDYQCQDCSNVFEVFHSMTAESVKACPKCDGKVKRLIGAGSGLIFKGSGFYITDYKNKKTSTTTDTGSKQDTSSRNTSNSNAKETKKAETKKSEK